MKYSLQNSLPLPLWIEKILYHDDFHVFFKSKSTCSNFPVVQKDTITIKWLLALSNRKLKLTQKIENLFSHKTASLDIGWLQNLLIQWLTNVIIDSSSSLLWFFHCLSSFTRGLVPPLVPRWLRQVQMLCWPIRILSGTTLGRNKSEWIKV